MSTDSISTLRIDLASRPLVAKLHEWVTTVDHKRLGILYMLYSFLFLLIAGRRGFGGFLSGRRFGAGLQRGGV